jgi:hypothetical protein
MIGSLLALTLTLTLTLTPVIGDSVMQQFYNAIACELEREGVRKVRVRVRVKVGITVTVTVRVCVGVRVTEVSVINITDPHSVSNPNSLSPLRIPLSLLEQTE